MINQEILTLNNPIESIISIDNLENGLYFIYVDTEIGIVSEKSC